MLTYAHVIIVYTHIHVLSYHTVKEQSLWAQEVRVVCRKMG